MGARTGRAALASFAADAVSLLAFAAVGRRNHGEGVTLSGVAHTAWPFLAGLAVAWLLCRAWRRPELAWPTGVSVWLITVAAAMGLRAGTGAGVAVSFVLVATAATGLLLVGRRLAVRAYRRGRRRRRSAPSDRPGVAGSR